MEEAIWSYPTQWIVQQESHFLSLTQIHKSMKTIPQMYYLLSDLTDLQ